MGALIKNLPKGDKGWDMDVLYIWENWNVDGPWIVPHTRGVFIKAVNAKPFHSKANVERITTACHCRICDWHLLLDLRRKVTTAFVPNIPMAILILAAILVPTF